MEASNFVTDHIENNLLQKLYRNNNFPKSKTETIFKQRKAWKMVNININYRKQAKLKALQTINNW